MATKRPDGRVEPGQRISSAFSARAWNRAQDAADVVLGARTGMQAGEPASFQRASNVVLVMNTTANTIPLGGVLSTDRPLPAYVAGGQLVNTSFDAQTFEGGVLRSMFSQPSFEGITPTANGPFAIALEPIEAGKIGPMAIGGCVYFRVRMVNRLHRYASPLAGSWTQLQSSGCGPVRIMWEEGTYSNRTGDNMIAFGVL